MEMMTHSEVNDAVRKMQEEASAETTMAFVCAKTNFKDAFVETDKRLGAKVVARYPRWEKAMSEEQRGRLAMLSCLDQSVRDFANHLSEALPEVREAISAEGEGGIFYLELRRFVAMKVFLMKADLAMKGRMSFFSTGGASAALALTLRQEARKFFHEARGRAAKYALEAGGGTEDKIEEIVRQVWHEHHDDLCGVLLRPLEFALTGTA